MDQAGVHERRQAPLPTLIHRARWTQGRGGRRRMKVKLAWGGGVIEECRLGDKMNQYRRVNMMMMAGMCPHELSADYSSSRNSSSYRLLFLTPDSPTVQACRPDLMHTR